MGEYAFRKSDGEYIKIGTCENMYYIRYEDRFKVTPEENSLDCSVELDLIWRLPFPEEDSLLPGEYEPFKHYVLGHLPFDDLKYWDSCWKLTGITNTASGIKAVLQGSKFRFKTFTTELTDVIPAVKDPVLKERLTKYLS